MLYLMEWSIKDGKHEEAVGKFLDTGAPMPTGCTLVGRYHASGSVNGWLIAETDDPTHIYAHASEWADYLNWKTTPVFSDEQAGVTSASIWKKTSIEESP